MHYVLEIWEKYPNLQLLEIQNSTVFSSSQSRSSWKPTLETGAAQISTEGLQTHPVVTFPV